jgi:hypothetical protein
MEQGGRYVQHGNRVPDQGQRRPQALEVRGAGGDREVAGLSPGGGTPLGQVDGEPLLQLTSTRRRNQGWPRLASADVDQQPGAIGLRAGAG